MSKKISFISFFICILVLAVMLSACESVAKTDNLKEPSEITFGGMPNTAYDNYKKEFEKKYPDIKVTVEEWEYDKDKFLPLAALGLLPTVYTVPDTEAEEIINSGYARDVTDFCKKYGFGKDTDGIYYTVLFSQDYVYLFSLNATEEEVEGAFLWLSFIGEN